MTFDHLTPFLVTYFSICFHSNFVSPAFCSIQENKMVTTSRKLFPFLILDGGYQKKELFFYSLPKMTKSCPKWLVDSFVMPTCAFTSPLPRHLRHQHRIICHRVTFHDEDKHDNSRPMPKTECNKGRPAMFQIKSKFRYLFVLGSY